jgi:hypothetical protein
LITSIIGNINQKLNYTNLIAMTKIPVYVSFDVANDHILREFITTMSHMNDSPFEIISYSSKKLIPFFSYPNNLRNEIKKSDILLVLLGPDTYKSKIVQLEVQIAIEEKIKIIQMNGYREVSYSMVAGTKKSYRWDWDNLKILMTNERSI